MKFAHLADVHIGAWRDPAMKGLSLEAFKRAIDIILESKIDFVIIAGDLFNTSLPAIDHLKEVVVQLKKLKKKKIPVYSVPGSHDYSPSGRTIIDVLEEAELLVNVMKGKVEDNKLCLEFTIDEKTGTKITGMRGKKGSLEKKEFEMLDKESLENESGKKIFIFHTSIDELKPKELEKMDSIPANEMPRGFAYYAGGHIHIVEQKSKDGYKNLVYPGPIYPTNFSELWKLERGGFYIYDDETGCEKLEFQPLNIKNVFKIKISADNKTPEEVSHELEASIKGKEFNNTIVLVRVAGKLKSGKPSDVNFKNFFRESYDKSAFFVMRNTFQFSSHEFEEIRVSSGTADQIEEDLIKEHSGKLPISFASDEVDLIKMFLNVLSDEQKEGEKKYEAEARIKKEIDGVLGF